ncbi:MAG: hypothetical protein RTU30_11530 [Candidatus Thorarchaeota archaeon]
MAIHTKKSMLSSNLYIVAAVFMIIQSALAFVLNSLLGPDPRLVESAYMVLVFAALFFVGAIFARTGLGITATTTRYEGGGYYRKTVDTANAITCGCMTGIASMGITVTTAIGYIPSDGMIAIVGVIPAVISSLFAMLAGGIAIRATYGEREAVPEVGIVREDSVTCAYCGKSSISPKATSCPNCGQPLQS